MDLSYVRQQVLAFLYSHDIPFECHEHERAHTIEQCLEMPFIDQEITICKNIFLCNRQKTLFFLLLLKPHTPFRTSAVSKALGVSRLSFAPEDDMENILHLTSGSVCPFGLMFDAERRTKLCYERAVTETRKIAFHPCDNSFTVVFDQEVFWKQVLPAMKIEPVCLVLDEND